MPGYPLMLDDGSCIGTLCLLDTRPRTLEGPDLERLHDLADIWSCEKLVDWRRGDVEGLQWVASSARLANKTSGC